MTDPNASAQDVTATHVSNYERPKYPDAEIQRRLGNLPGLMSYAKAPLPPTAPASTAISNATFGDNPAGPADMQAIDHYQDMQQDAGSPQSANTLPIFAQVGQPMQVSQFGFGSMGQDGAKFRLLRWRSLSKILISWLL